VHGSCVQPPWRLLEGATTCGQRAPLMAAWPQAELTGTENFPERLVRSSEVEGSGSVNWRGSPEGGCNLLDGGLGFMLEEDNLTWRREGGR